MFQQWKYTKIYEALIQKAWNRNWCSSRYKIKGINPKRKTEVHHIIPKCLGGDDSLINLAVLTPKEHYIAHLLLTKIFSDVSKIKYPLNIMKKYIDEKNLNIKLSNQSELMKERWKNPEYRNKMSKNARKWAKENQEIIEKRKLIYSKKFKLGGNPNSKKVINLETKKIYSCLKEAALELNINYSTFKNYLRNKKFDKCKCMLYNDYIKGVNSGKFASNKFRA